jgi:hypothetical protein
VIEKSSISPQPKTIRKMGDGAPTCHFCQPGNDKETNWLPASAAPFSLYIPTYWPNEEVINGSWMPPEVKKV